MTNVIQFIVGLFSNGAGQKIGTAVSWSAQVAVLSPIIIWLLAHKGESAVTMTFNFTYGEVVVICGIAFFILKIIQYTRPGSPSNRSDFRE